MAIGCLSFFFSQIKIDSSQFLHLLQFCQENLNRLVLNQIYPSSIFISEGQLPVFHWICVWCGLIFFFFRFLKFCGIVLCQSGDAPVIPFSLFSSYQCDWFDSSVLHLPMWVSQSYHLRAVLHSDSFCQAFQTHSSQTTPIMYWNDKGRQLLQLLGLVLYGLRNWIYPVALTLR